MPDSVIAEGCRLKIGMRVKRGVRVRVRVGVDHKRELNLAPHATFVAPRPLYFTSILLLTYNVRPLSSVEGKDGRSDMTKEREVTFQGRSVVIPRLPPKVS